MKEVNGQGVGEPNNGVLAPYTSDRTVRVARPVRWRGPAGGSLSAGSLAKAFRSRWLLATCVGLCLGAAAAAAGWFLIPAKYTAVALLQVLPSEPNRLFTKEERGEVPERSAYQKTQAALVTSRNVLRAALKDEKVRTLKTVKEQPDPAGWLEKELKVGFIEDSDLLRISLSGTEPADLEVLVNALLDAYREMGADAERKSQQDQLEDLKVIYFKTQGKLREDKDALATLARTLRSGDPQALTLQQKAAIETLTAHRRELGTVEAQLRAAELKQTILGSQQDSAKVVPAAQGEASAVDEYVDADPRIQKQAAEVEQLERALEELKTIVATGHPKLEQAQRALSSARSRLEKLRAERRTALVSRVQARAEQDAQAALRAAKDEVRFLNDQLKKMKEAEAKLRADAEKTGIVAFELEAKRAEVEQEEALLKSIRDKKDRLELELQGSKRRVTEVQRAEAPETKNMTLQVQGTVFAGLCAFFCGAFGISYREFRTRKIRTSDEVAHELELTVLGTLPALPRRALAAPSGGHSAEDRRWEGILSESVSYIRTLLLSPTGDRRNQVIMISSAEPREGKTMLAGHLALSIARAGRRTLLVDGDLRQPSLGRLFDVSLAPGLCEALRGAADLADAVRPSSIDGLSVLPAGQCSVEVIRKLANEGLESLLDRLRAEYDVIIVDSSPLLLVSDGLLLGKHMDAVVLCVRPEVSRAPAVVEACERLRGLHIPLLGIVVNGAPAEYKAYSRYLAPAALVDA